MPMNDVAMKFFEACETGKGWEGCKAYCHPNATFTAQAEPLADVKTLETYCDWMKGLLGFMPDGRYELRRGGSTNSARTSRRTASFTRPTLAKAVPVRQRAGRRGPTMSTS